MKERSLRSRLRPQRLMTPLGVVMGTLFMCALAPSLASARTDNRVCSGTDGNPGVLSGNYNGDVKVEGWCFVNRGPANVRGSLTVSRDGVLVAAFGRDNSGLSVGGSVRVLQGGTMLLGCEPGHFTCLDDPNQASPTLSSAGRVGRDLWAFEALGVIVHNSTIGGRVYQVGGGGGVNCAPSGAFAKFGSPVYSDYEDTTVGRSLVLANLRTCWVGVARVHVGTTAVFSHIQLADRDGVEIIDNHIGENLACFDNSMVWDSADISGTSALFPRQPEPNTVEGKRFGQCVYASPSYEGGPLGTTPF